MTKLEQKLIELGYEKKSRNRNKYSKHWWFCKLNICLHKEKIADFYVGVNTTIDNQLQVELIQQAFNQLQKDWEVLKEYE